MTWPNKLGYAFLIFGLIVCAPSFAQNQVVANDEHGTPIIVSVYDSCAHKNDNMAWAFVEARQIYLCHNETKQSHEIWHFAGMRHTAWHANGNGVDCARVTDPGYQTPYRKDDLICVAPLGRGEFVER